MTNFPFVVICVLKNNLQQYKDLIFEKIWGKNVSSINVISTKYVKNKRCKKNNMELFHDKSTCVGVLNACVI